jgi:hypothetical protein
VQTSASLASAPRRERGPSKPAEGFPPPVSEWKHPANNCPIGRQISFLVDPRYRSNLVYMRNTLLALIVLAGCSSSTTPGTGTGGNNGTGGGAGTSATGGIGGQSGTGGAGGGATAGFTLTIQNYLNWCNVTENGTAYDPPNEAPVMTFPSGTVVHLMGATASSASFLWGYWVGTDGDTTASHDTNMTTTVTMTANKVVQACCPLTSAPTAPCPAPTP